MACLRPLALVAVLLAFAAPGAQAQSYLSLGNSHTCVLTRPSGGATAVKCWGANRYGQLGLGDTQARGDGPGEMGDALPAVDLGAPPLQVVAGGYHTCALLTDATVRCWGSNERGQLGLGDTQARGDGPGEMGDALPTVALPGAPVVALALGEAHSCALDASGSVRCWGDNGLGQLGLGDTQARGDGPGEMGDALPTVLLPGPAQALTAGANHTCALLTDATVRCWGSNERGQLGLGDTQARGDGPGEMGAALPAVALPGAVHLLRAGGRHTCALDASGSVRCWGDNGLGQLGLGDTRARGDGPAEMGAALPAVALPGPAGAVEVGRRSTCAILSSGALRCWGDNAFGQLGLGDTTPRGTALDADTPLLAAPQLLALGATSACAVLDTHAVQCWGSGDAGRLGLEDTRTRGALPGEMGAALPLVGIGAAALPVELVALSAVGDGADVVVRWTTLGETNNAGFAVERRGPIASGADAWTEVGFVTGRGTTSERADYSFRMASLRDGRYEIRLRQMDLDGAATYSRVLTVEVRATGVDGATPYQLVSLSPNPFRASATVSLTVAVPQTVRVTVADALGREVTRLYDGPVAAGAPLVLTLDGGALAPGPYVLRIDGEHLRVRRTLVHAR